MRWMVDLVPPTPPAEFLQATWSLAEHELFSLKAPAFAAQCCVRGFESHMKLVVPQDCSVELSQQGAALCLAPGQVGLLPLNSSFHIAASCSDDGWGRIFQWRLPTSVLTRRHTRLDVSALRAIRDSTPAERLLAQLLSSLAHEFAQLSQSQMRTTLSTLVEALGLLEQVDPIAGDDRRIARALSYIQVHLHSPELDADQVAGAQGVSRRYLDAVFKRKQKRTVSDAIRTLRLERAALVLSGEPETAILPLALSLGFENASHFARRFKEYTQLSPSDFRHKSRTTD